MWGTLKLLSMDLALWILQCVLELPVSMTQVLFGYERSFSLFAANRGTPGIVLRQT